MSRGKRRRRKKQHKNALIVSPKNKALRTTEYLYAGNVVYALVKKSFRPVVKHKGQEGVWIQGSWHPTEDQDIIPKSRSWDGKMDSIDLREPWPWESDYQDHIDRLDKSGSTGTNIHDSWSFAADPFRAHTGKGPTVLIMEGSFLRACIDECKDAGLDPIIASQRTELDELATLYNMANSLILLGGSDINPFYYGEENELAYPVEPRRDSVEIALAKQALTDSKPLLGICRGLQVMAVAAGHRLWQDVDYHGEEPPKKWYKFNGSHENTEHLINITGRTLRGIMGRRKMKVNSYHHQAVRLVNTATYGILPQAWASGKIIEAAVIQGKPTLGFQFHPEVMQGTEPIFLWLLREAEKWGKKQ